jgi:hypothetical protein
MAIRVWIWIAIATTICVVFGAVFDVSVGLTLGVVFAIAAIAFRAHQHKNRPPDSLPPTSAVQTAKMKNPAPR